MDANDIRRQNEARFALVREQIARADRLQALLGLQAAVLALAAVALLIALVILALLPMQGLLRVSHPLGLAVVCGLGGAAVCALAAAGGAGCALLRMHRGRPASGGGRPAGLFFDLLETAGVFAPPAEFGPAFRSALNEEMIGFALAELQRAIQAARRQRVALRWTVGCLLVGVVLLVAGLILGLLGA